MQVGNQVYTLSIGAKSFSEDSLITILLPYLRCLTPVGQGTLCPTQIIAETAKYTVTFINIEEILLSFTCSYDTNFVSLPRNNI